MPSRKSNSNATRGVKAPQRPGSQQRVANLLAAGAGLFAEKGFDAATMTEIAANAGASIGSLYQYFPAKEPLAATLHASQIASLNAMVEQLKLDCAGHSADQFCDQLFARLTDFLDANASFPVLNERRTVDPEMQATARGQLRRGVNDLLAVIEPPVPLTRRAALAAVILHLMRITALISRDDDASIRESAIDELRAMLAVHMSS